MPEWTVSGNKVRKMSSASGRTHLILFGGRWLPIDMDEKEKKLLSTEEYLYRTGLAALPFFIIGAWLVTNWVVPRLPAAAECMFWKFWGIYCPGCGGTRAVLALLRGDFLLSAWYHPMVMYAVLMYAWFMLSHTLEKLHVPLIKGMKFEVWIMYGMLVVLVLNCILKNVLKFGFGILM